MSSMDYVKKRIIVSMIAIVLLLITLFGITYAYFLSKVKGNENDKSVSVTGGRLELKYDGNDSYVKVTGLQPGQKIESKTFSVENVGKNTVENYDIILENVVNELESYEDLTYVLECSSSDSNDCTGSEGIFPKRQEVIATNTIEPGTIHSYILTLTYHETNEDQSHDMNKEISAKVNIKDDISNIKTLKIYGNSTQDGTPTPTSPVEIVSLGDRTNNLIDMNALINIENYNYFSDSKDIANMNLSLEEGKNYTIQIKSIDGATLPTSMSFALYNNNSHITGINGGVKRFTATDNVYLSLYAPNVNSTLSLIPILSELIEVDIIEGSYTEDTLPTIEPYGYKIPITVNGKNLFDINKVEKGWLNSSNGSIVSSSNSNTTDYIPITYNESLYVYNSSGANIQSWGIIYDEDYNPILPYVSCTSGSADNFVIKNPYENGKYIRLTTAANTYENPELLERTMINYGEEREQYEPYISSTYNIYLDEPLRKIGDYADYIDYENRQIVRNVFSKKFNSSDFTKDISIGTNNNVIKSNNLENIKNINNYTSSSQLLLSNRYGIMEGKIDTTWSESYNINKIGKPVGKFLWFGIGTNITTLEDARTYMDEIEPIVNYVLETPTTEIIEMPVLDLNSGSKISVCDSKNICASNIEIEYDT